MNPFDLSGPQFLVFYIGIALIVVIAMKLAIDMGEGGAVAGRSQSAGGGF